MGGGITSIDLTSAQAAAVRAARAAGALMRRELRSTKRASSSTQHDIKLELDVRCQHLIERTLAASFPQIAVLGEEGNTGAITAHYRWVVDPIDGTVNFAYGVPHACVSIALQSRSRAGVRKKRGLHYLDGYQTVIGIVHDPFCNELWTAIRGRAAQLNGRRIHVSRRRDLAECIVSIGFSKSAEHIRTTLPYFNWLVARVRKVRMMGAAALGLAYVATGRFDAYIERGIRLWDIAAGGLLIECAGGEFWREPLSGDQAYRMVASNGLLRKKLRTG